MKSCASENLKFPYTCLEIPAHKKLISATEDNPGIWNLNSCLIDWLYLLSYSTHTNTLPCTKSQFENVKLGDFPKTSTLTGK